MKRILLALVLVLAMAGWGWAAAHPAGTYYVSQTGAGSGDGSSVANARSVANHNTDTWAGPSTIYLLDAITTGIVPPSSGADAAHIITYDGGYAGHVCDLDGGGVGATGFDFSGKNYLTIQNLSVRRWTSRNIKSDVASTGCSLTNITSANCSSLGIRLINSVSATLVNITDTAATNGNIYVSGGSNLSINTATVSGGGAVAGGLYITGVTTATLSNITASTTVIAQPAISILSTTGLTGINLNGSNSVEGILLNATSGTITGGTFTANRQGLEVISCTNLTLNNLIALSNVHSAGTDGSGFKNTTGSTNVVYNNCIADSNQWDGFTYTGDTHSGLQYNSCIARNNGGGEIPAVNCGDGFTGHNASNGIAYTNCQSYNNKNSGFAFVGTGYGTITGCKVWNNGSARSIRGGYWSMVNNAINKWTLRNNIIFSNYPNEINVDANGLANLDADYNHYVHPADANFAKIDGVNNISWTTYHTTDGYEPNST